MNNETVVAIVTAVFASSGLWSIILYVVQTRDKNRSEVRKALLALLHDRIYAECEKAMTQGHVSIQEFKNISYLYEPYRDLGGNGTGKMLYETVQKLKKTED